MKQTRLKKVLKYFLTFSIFFFFINIYFFINSQLKEKYEIFNCNFPNCEGIPKPVFNETPGYFWWLWHFWFPHDEYDLIDLTVARNKQEKKIYNLAKKMCYRLRKKTENHEKKQLGNTVKVYWPFPSSWWDIPKQLNDFEIQNCSVGCEIVNRKEEADIWVLQSYLRRNLGPLSPPRRKSLYTAYISIEGFLANNAYASKKNDNNEHIHMLDNIINYVDYVISYFPFSDIPIYYTDTKFFEKMHIKQNKMLGSKALKFGKFNKKLFFELWEKKKDNLVIVNFVSNCGVAPFVESYYRTMYIMELEKYIKIDNYGTCPYFNNRKREPRDLENRFLRKHLFMMESKFSLAFENGIIYSYFTEKIQKVLTSKYTIPIYMGAPNAIDFFPDELRNYKVFINANEYRNPKDLADRILYLHNNDTAYLEYFQWRFDNLEFNDNENLPCSRRNIDKKGNNISILCRLCEFHKNGKKSCHQRNHGKEKWITYE